MSKKKEWLFIQDPPGKIKGEYLCVKRSSIGTIELVCRDEADDAWALHVYTKDNSDICSFYGALNELEAMLDTVWKPFLTGK